MKELIVFLFVLVATRAHIIPESYPVPIHYIQEWRDAFPTLAALMPIDKDLQSSRITGGQEAEIGQFPYQAYVEPAFNVGVSVCGGSLIAINWVLTAAHCTDPASGIVSVEVKLGSHRRLELDSGEQRLTANEIILHPEWNVFTIEHDVAVLAINPVILSATVNLVPLTAADGGFFVGATGIVSGWGRTGDGAAQTFSNTLQFVYVDVISNEDCTQTFGDFVRVSNICTSGENARNACSGDSGGPLVLASGQQIGVVSFGANNCQNGSPAAYARITYYRSWINEVTGV